MVVATQMLTDLDKHSILGKLESIKASGSITDIEEEATINLRDARGRMEGE